MNSMLLLEAIGQLDEDLLERSENASRKKNTVRRVIRWTAFAACLCVVFAWGSQFLSLGSKKADLSNGENAPMENPQAVKPMEKPGENEAGYDSILFDVSYIRVQGGMDKASQVSVINSSDELDAYVENSELITAMQKYDAGFFAEKQLIVLQLEEKDKGMAPKITNIVRNPQQETVVVNIYWEPSQQAEESAYWHICIEVQKGLAVTETVKLQHHLTVAEPTKDLSQVPGAILHIVDIWDATQREQIECIRTEEKFYEDETTEYYFPVTKSQYIMVMNSIGKITDVVTALNTGRIMIADLDYNGIEYYTKPKR